MKKLFVLFFLILLFCGNAEAQLFKVKTGADHPYKHKVSDLRSTNSASDGLCASYDSATGTIEWVTCGTGGGSGGDFFLSGWTDVGARVQLYTSTDNVSIGDAITGGKLFVIGDANEKQLQVRAFSSQTTPTFSVEGVSGQNRFSVMDTGVTSYVDMSVNGDLTVQGNDIIGGTNVDRTVWMADGTNFSPEVIDLGTDTTGNYAGSGSEGGAATTAVALDADPADCAANEFATTIAASGALTCEGVDLGSQTAGNYVASVATIDPLTGGAAGSEGGALSLALVNTTGSGPVVRNTSPVMTGPTVQTSFILEESGGTDIMTGASGGIKVTGALQVTGQPSFTGLNCTQYANGGTLTTDAGGFVMCRDDDSGAGGGDSITVNSSAATDPDFADGDVDWTLTGGNSITATVGCTDCVTLTTETAGNYVSTISVIDPITGSATTEGSTPTLALVNTTGTGPVVRNTSPVTTGLTSQTTFTVEQSGGTDIMTGATGGVGITGGLSVSGNVFLTAANKTNCANLGNAGKLTVDAAGNVLCAADVGSGAASGWDDNTTDVNLTTSTDNVGIGGSSLAKLSVDGDTDEIQLLAQGNATQTANILVIEQSDGTDIMTASNTGVKITGSLVIPSAAAASIDTVGEMIVDTTDDQLQYYGGAKRVIPYEHTRCATIENLAAADDNIPIGSFTDGVTITAAWCTCSGTCTTKANFSLEDGSGNAFTMSTPSCSNIGTVPTKNTMTSANSLVSLESLRFDVTNSVSPETDEYELCWSYTIDSQ